MNYRLQENTTVAFLNLRQLAKYFVLANFFVLSQLVTILSPVRAPVTHKELSFNIN